MYCANDPVDHTDPSGKIAFGTLGSTLLRSAITGTVSGMYSGIRSKAAGGDFWKAALGGFAGGAVGGGLASFSSMGYIVQSMAAGAVSGGTESALNGNGYQRVLLDIGFGAAIGGITGSVMGGIDSNFSSKISWQALDGTSPFGRSIGEDIMELVSPWLGTIGNDCNKATGLSDFLADYLEWD